MLRERDCYFNTTARACPASQARAGRVPCRAAAHVGLPCHMVRCAHSRAYLLCHREAGGLAWSRRRRTRCAARMQAPQRTSQRRSCSPTSSCWTHRVGIGAAPARAPERLTSPEHQSSPDAAHSLLRSCLPLKFSRRSSRGALRLWWQSTEKLLPPVAARASATLAGMCAGDPHVGIGTLN